MLASRVEFDPAPSTSSRSIIGPSADRVLITFIAPQTGLVTLSNMPVTADGAGIVLTAGQAPVSFHADIHGDIVRQGWYAKYTAGATGVAWVQAVE